MQAAWTWLGQNWLTVALVALGLVQVINKATDRWDISASSKGKRFLLLLTELLSFVTSKDFRGTLGLFKLPLNPYGGKPKTLKPKPVFPPGPISFLSILLVGCVLLDVGCASTWEQTADKSIKSAMITAQGGWNTARAVYQGRCAAHINACTNPAGLEMCDAYKACAAERRSHATMFRSVLVLCAEASDALEAYKRLDDASESGAQVSSSEQAKLKAQVQGQTNRAIRASVEFMRALRMDRVIQ